MEASGIVWVTHLYDVPFLALKSVTDIVDGERPPQEEFLENLHKAVGALQVRCVPGVRAVCHGSCVGLRTQ